MKKTLCALLALLLALSVAACGKKVPTPSETVSAALDALKSGDMTAAAETWGGSISSIENSTDSDADIFKLLFKNLTYSVLSETEDGSAATVKVKLSNTDMSAVMGDVLAEAMQTALSSALSGKEMDETKTQKMVMDSLKDKMTNGSYGTAEKEVEFQLTMTDGVWTLSQPDDTVIDALTDGLMSAGTSLLG